MFDARGSVSSNEVFNELFGDDMKDIYNRKPVNKNPPPRMEKAKP
jgi:hypothetical protein